MSDPGASVAIHYRRPPDRATVFDQRVVWRSDSAVVTWLEHAEVSSAVRVDGRPVLHPGAPIVWLTFPGAWHDIGRFHLEDGTFTGYYANVLTPVEMSGARWETTDLFLDVWLGVDGRVRILDEDELAEATARGWIDGAAGRRAREEAARLAHAARRGTWPPPVAREWTLERVRRTLDGYDAPPATERRA